jgi:hypothetical protein
VFQVPFGLGIAVKPARGFVLDLRATGRAAFDDGMMQGALGAGEEARLHQWNAGLRLGYEF